jgi:two-component system, OmpR family, KDP operon response regulator KdpE
MLTLILADDHPVMRRGLRNLIESSIECEVLAEASDGKTALMLTERMHPDLLITDISMPELNGLEITRRISEAGLSTRVIILSMHTDQVLVREALLAGAAAYVSKEALADNFIGTIRQVAIGRPVQEFMHPAPAPEMVPPVRLGENLIDVTTRTITRGTQIENLTPTEARLLNELLRASGQTLTYEILLRRVWGESYGPDNRHLLYEQIRTLRRKLGDDTRQPQLLRTQPGEGYALVTPEPVEQSPRANLTERERGIARLVAQGHTNRAIADQLGISERTVETYLRRIFPKINVSSRAALASWATRSGLG